MRNLSLAVLACLMSLINTVALGGPIDHGGQSTISGRLRSAAGAVIAYRSSAEPSDAESTAFGMVVRQIVKVEAEASLQPGSQIVCSSPFVKAGGLYLEAVSKPD
jgi:hypothetical protein